MKPTHDSIRGWFAAALHDEMEKDDRIWLLTADLGFGMMDSCRDDFPTRFLNVGASEQVLLGTGIGLALSGKIPFCYSITSFLVYRPFEWIRNFMWYEDVPVRLVGSGLDADYAHDGITHQPYEVQKVFNLLPNIQQFYPETKEQVPAMVREMIEQQKPAFICLRR
jgi:transketolase